MAHELLLRSKRRWHTALKRKAVNSFTILSCDYNFDISMAVAAADFPQLCESCLGSSPYVKMQRTPIGGTCKICIRPFELFKWRPGRGESYKRTEVSMATRLGSSHSDHVRNVNFFSIISPCNMNRYVEHAPK